ILKIAEKKGCSAAQVLIGWAMERGTAVIPKSVDPGRLAENFQSLAIELSSGDMESISMLDRNARYIRGDFWTMPGSPYTLQTLWE
ncbi:MAG: aldo/keto reductase, partial [Deltaproteobacteria bacterium]